MLLRQVEITEAEFILLMRRRMGLTQAGLAAWAGCNSQTVKRAESNVYMPHLRTYLAMKLEKHYATGYNNTKNTAGGSLRSGGHDENHNGGAVPQAAGGAG